MRTVVICSETDLQPALEATVLWRQEFERHFASNLEEAQKLSGSASLVLIERDLVWAKDLIKCIRRESATRTLSVAILAPDDFAPSELELLEAGANGVLRIPADEEWDKRLARLLQVATRKQARLPIHLQLEASFGSAEDPFTADTVDLSETGMLIESPAPLGLGRELNFAFQLPDRPGLISGQARVARLAPRARYGVEFTSLSGEDLDQLRAFIEAGLSTE